MSYNIFSKNLRVHLMDLTIYIMKFYDPHILSILKDTKLLIFIKLNDLHSTFMELSIIILWKQEKDFKSDSIENG